MFFCGHSAPLLWQAKRLLLDVPRSEIDLIMADAFDIADRDRLNKAIGREEGMIGLWQFRRGGITTTHMHTRTFFCCSFCSVLLVIHIDTLFQTLVI